jgi:hypothetical protein
VKTILKIVTTLLCAFVFTTAHSASLFYKKTWWDPNQNGMGTFCDPQTSVTVGGVSSEIIFCAWFHYTPGSQPTFLTFSGTLAKDSLGRDTLSGPLVRTNSSQPMGYDPSRFVVTTPGTFTITFNSETSAKFVYSFEGQSGTLNWVPQIFATDATALHYTEKVISIKVGYPHMVTKTGTVKVVNKTQYQAGAIPLGICEYGYPQLTDGKVLTRCTNAVATASTPALTRVISYVNPVTGEQFDFTGTVPANIVWRSVENNTNKPEWGAKARVSDGWYFTPANATSNLKFQPDTGAITDIENVVGSIQVMDTFTN